VPEGDGQLTVPRAGVVSGARRVEPLPAEQAILALLAGGQISTADIVDDDIRVESIPARNRGLRVAIGKSRGYFIKQAEPGDQGTSATLAREASFYAFATSNASDHALHELIPPFTGFDAAESRLTLGLIPDAGNAHELDTPDGPITTPLIGALLGQALAVCHASRVGQGLTTLGAPWVFDIARPTPAMLRDLASSQISLIRQLQRSAELLAVLARLRIEWAPETLIHGDIKWGNVLVRRHPDGGAPERLWLVDWEFAGLGDAAWDVGSALHGFLADCVHAVVYEADREGSTPGDAFGAALPGAQRQAAALWTSYAQQRSLSGDAATGFLERALRCCTARLVQSAYEWCHGEPDPPRDAVAALQLAINLARLPMPAAAATLGIAVSSRA
jgi:hypothetical protein